MIILKNKQYYYWNKKSVSPWVKYDEEMNHKFSYINKILFKNINIKKNQSVLDIGCGSARPASNAEIIKANSRAMKQLEKKCKK